MDYREIGARMQALRKARGMTQEQLAERTGITPAYMSQLVIETICALGIRVSELRFVTVEALRAGKTEGRPFDAAPL